MKNSKKQRLFEVMQSIDSSFKSQVNEIANNEWSFYSKSIPADIEGIKEKFYPQAEYVDAYHQKVDVKWHIVPEFREYGIKSMMIVIDAVSGTISYEIVSTDENAENQEAWLDVEKYQWEFNAEIVSKRFGDAIYPTDVQFDFNTMKCNVIFA